MSVNALIGSAANATGYLAGNVLGIDYFKKDRGWGEALGAPSYQYQSAPSIGQETIQNYPGTQVYGGGTIQGPINQPTNYQPTPTTTTTINNTPTGDPNEGRAGYFRNEFGQWVPEGDPVKSWEDQQRETISKGYDEYFGGLNSMMNSLPGQADLQRGQVNASYDASIGDVDAQNAIGVRDLANSRNAAMSNQDKNLKALSESLRNQFLQGQVMLGQRGAGDSSAANMYSYALTKLGSKQRSDIMNQTASDVAQIADREFKLQTTVNTEKNRLRSERDSQLSSVGLWLQEEQNKIRQMIGEGQIRKANDIAAISTAAFNQALQQMAMVKQEYANRRSMLDSWALNNAQTINQLKANLNAVSQYAPSLPQATGIYGRPTFDAAGNMQTRFTGGNGNYFSDDEKKQLGIA